MRYGGLRGGASLKDLLSLLKLTRPHWALYSAALLTLGVGTTLLLFIPPQLGKFVNSLHEMATGSDGDGVMGVVFTIAGMLSLQALTAVIHTFFVSLISERIVNGLRGSFFRNLVSQPLDRCSPKQLGEIASEFGSDMALIQDGLSTTMINFLRNSLFTLGAIIALLLIHFRMTVMALAGVGLVAFVILWFIRTATSSIIAVQRYRAKVMALLVEGAANAYVIQAYGREAYMNGRFASRLEETFVRVRHHLFLMASMSPVSLIVFSFVMAAVVIYGSAEVQRAHLSIEGLVSYLTYAVVLVGSASQVGYLGGRMRQAGAMVTKHHHMLTPGCDRNGRGTWISTEPVGHPIRCIGTENREPFGFIAQELTFSYAGSDATALVDVSFCIPPGKVTAIVGESGAGKSTIAGILCGLYRPRGRVIQVVGQDGTVTPVSPLRAQNIAIVPQEPFLFAGTIFENITFGRDCLSRVDAQHAATAARIHEYIIHLPSEYDTQVEEAGKNLSRGQRQRLAIARALVGKPSVLILDEATASLDIVSERAIRALIDDLRGSVTVVIIAHQGELLTKIDHLIILERGRRVYEGRPEDIDLKGELAGLLRLALNRSRE